MHDSGSLLSAHFVMARLMLAAPFSAYQTGGFTGRVKAISLPTPARRVTSLLCRTLPRSCVSDSLQQCCALALMMPLPCRKPGGGQWRARWLLPTLTGPGCTWSPCSCTRRLGQPSSTARRRACPGKSLSAWAFGPCRPAPGSRQGLSLQPAARLAARAPHHA